MSKNLIETKPKIGFMTIGLNAYWVSICRNKGQYNQLS